MSYLVFDLETVTDGWAPPADKPDAFPPPWACSVVVAAWAELGDDFGLIRCGAMAAPNYPGRERDLLLDFSRGVQTMRGEHAKRKDTGPILVTWNGRGFDVPVLIARSLRHAVPMPWYLKDENKRKRYSTKSHLDLMDQIADYGAGRMSSLDAIAKSIGLPGKTDTTGNDVAGMVAAGEIDRVRAYGLDDVAQTALLLVRWRAIQGLIAPADLGAIESKLRGQFADKGILRPRDLAPVADDFG